MGDLNKNQKCDFDELLLELVRVQEIQNFCEAQGIQSLVHFTRAENLESIFKHGLAPREQVENNLMHYFPIFNDEQRLDGVRNSVCLTISFPNYKMFYKYRKKCQGDWVVLILYSTILYELECVFCFENAASHNVKDIPLSERRTSEALKTLFQDLPGASRNDLKLPPTFTTNPQAEVLVLERIPTSYLSEIHFIDKPTYEIWLKKVPEIAQFDVNYDSPFFAARHDWFSWSKYYL